MLEVRDLRTSFFLPAGEVRAVDSVSFELARGRTLGLVGESGCGKTMTALSILRLVPPPGRIVGGQVLLDGRDLLALPEREMRRVRGNDIAMVFQEPATSLNPVFPVGEQIAETLRYHKGMGRREAWARAVEMLRLVEIPEPERRAREYPHQLSGGMKQRVVIAIALSCEPRVLVADEPTTALDVTIEAQILDLIESLQNRFRMALLLVTHDLGIVAQRAHEVAIMYAGKIVERAPTEELFSRPLHPYTSGLLQSIPRIGPGRGERLRAIPGQVPDPLHWPSGCRFRDRCPGAGPECAAETPPYREARAGHFVACYHAGEVRW
ncbi:MAG: ABC transporter ATP-binding protein [Candidatus Binatia bacterium]|nr:MAG: ABC transporter ATP-binding protein [Candidatus Binatia bacterium]